MELSQNSRISSDEGTKGFDLSAGKTWIYPENYPIRDYQFNIVQACLYKNTLVCLPTGLGKTFIAAVVMYNFWRWYPCGKVVFLAPTKPLVAQQIFACHNTMGIPSIETIELTGAVNHKQREIAWSKKRVIFATPQVFHNDLDKNVVPSDLVKCVVIDEAHKALGKHSYCECIRILNEKNQTFRVLALSATPGNKIDNVHEVLQNLLIAHIELRDETSLDIIPYINKRKVDIILVPLNKKLAEYKERYIFIMDRHVKILLQHNILHGHTANISKGRIFHLLKEYQKKTHKSGNYGQIIKTLNILMTMYHAYELMIRDGLRAFHKFYQNHSDKFWMNDEPQLQTLLEDITTYLGPFPDICEEAGTEIPQNLIFGHTKFDKLKELLLHHFKKSEEKQSDTRAIVFVEYRDIVSEVYILLLQCRPLIRPQMFVGQAGQKQKQQIKALENFRNNHVNVLISTSIGEEGLDVGEVDLIICFDVSQHSPTRLVQRMGRTGRKRDGHIIILVTDGKEHETLKSTMARRDSLNYKILNTSNIFSSLYQNNPRMIPDVFTPECLRMQISVQAKSPVTKYKKNKGKSDKKSEKKCQNTLNKISNTESNFESQKDGANFSMMKYLKIEQIKEHKKGSSEIYNSEIIQNNNGCKTIPSSDVKVLSCDNEAVDFLTICALRISFMHTFGRFYYAISPELDAKILRIPYDGRKFALYLLLPRNRTLDGIEHLINEVTPFMLTRYVWQMQNLPIAVSIPKFKYQFSSHMEPVLREVGIRNIFDDTATLTGIAQTRRISSNLKVSDILQKTGIEVNENGTTAYVATEIDIGNKIGEEIFHADHPFLFYIEDESTGTIIYIGRMMNPLDTTGSTASWERHLSQSPPKLNAGISNADSISQAGMNAEDRNNLFNMYFPQALSKKYKDGNLVSSPASVKTILTMLMEGANGNTKSEIISVLRLPPEGKSRRGELAQRILASLNRNENGTEIALTTRLWVHENLRVSNNYKNILRSRYQGDIESVNFMESQSTARHINEWVRRVTHNTISSALLLNDLPPDTRLILTSVIYFKGLWLKSFDKANTKLQCFYIPNGECRNTYFMKHASIYRYAYIPSIEAHVLEIPYSDGKTSMLTLMPRSRENDPYLRILSDDLITVPVSAILANLKKQDITIHLPKFNIENNLNLVPTLRHLGIENIFQPNTNLSRMISDSSIHVTSILQNVKLEIDEEGTLAATDTEIGYKLLSSWGNDVKMDRPFLFMIIDTVLNMTLFSGRFIEPLK